MVVRVLVPLLGMLLLCTGLGVAPLGAPRLHVARTSMQPRAAVARMVSLTTPIDYTFLNEKVFTRGIDEAKCTILINVLAAAEYHTAGDILAANPETFRSSLHNIGVVESYQDTLCNWQTKELQARDRPLPGPTCTHDSRPGRQTPLSVSRAQRAKPRRLRGRCPPLPHPPRLQGWFGRIVSQGWFGRIVSLNWLNSKLCIVFVGCAIIYAGSPIHGLYDICKPLATRFAWASYGWRGATTYVGALLGSLVRVAAELRYLWCSAR